MERGSVAKQVEEKLPVRWERLMRRVVRRWREVEML
jgi:hypothetical protein